MKNKTWRTRSGWERKGRAIKDNEFHQMLTTNCGILIDVFEKSQTYKVDYTNCMQVRGTTNDSNLL